ncbi:type III-B CRISPR module-associated protein Cmr5 [Caloranaerobacter azorensis]|nr:type III-B CRISPR module-associated protein Cmr5 [Caloranaerobacter azorensis]
MSSRRISHYIVKCMEVLDNINSEDNIVDNEGRIPREFNGYISSFGACIIQNGLLPAVAFFENKNANSQQDRRKLMKIILKVLDEETKENSLFQYLLKNKSEEKILRKEIINIVIALQQVIRTYELV